MASDQKVLISYINIEVTNLDRSVAFFKDKVGLELDFTHADFGYASFESSKASLGLVQNEQAQGDRHIGLGFMVERLDDAYASMSAAGVEFTQPPTREDWGGYMAIFKDPDGNTYHLDQTDPEPDPDADQEGMDFDVAVDLTASSINKGD